MKETEEYRLAMYDIEGIFLVNVIYHFHQGA